MRQTGQLELRRGSSALRPRFSVSPLISCHLYMARYLTLVKVTYCNLYYASMQRMCAVSRSIRQISVGVLLTYAPTYPLLFPIKTRGYHFSSMKKMFHRWLERKGVCTPVSRAIGKSP